MILTEQIQLQTSQQLSWLCHCAKNLYNEANFLIRQRFFQDRYWTRYTELNRVLKMTPTYQALPAQSSQQILRLLDKNWKSFFNAIKDWSQHTEKYLGRPKLPRYKQKNGESVVVFTNQQCHIKEGYVMFPKKSGLAPIKTRLQTGLRQVRILPQGTTYMVEIVYEREITDLCLDQRRLIGIDLGLTNLVTIVNNVGIPPFIVKGGMVKSINQYYNKHRARYRSINDTQGYAFTTKRLQKLALKRNNKINDLFHQISRRIIQFCVTNNIGMVIVGYNPGWKQRIRLGKRTNQQFVQVPFSRFLQMLTYKAKLVGIQIELIDEAHTSKCSFLDKEAIRHHTHYLGRRVKRGLFQSHNGQLINADVNGAYNIIQKAVPKAFAADGIEALGLVPQSIQMT